METYVLHVTKECNLDCIYCYEKDKKSTYTWEEVKKTLDTIIENRTSDEFHIEFLGGEPMMAFDNIKNTIDYYNKKLKELVSIYFSITTNGTIINEELFDLMKNNDNLSFNISIDGNKFMNQMRIYKNSRKGSYDDVIKNFKTLRLAKIPDSQLGCHLSTTPYSIGYLKQGVLSLANHGFKSFGIGTIESTITIGKEYCDKFISEMKELSNMIKSGELNVSISELNHLKPRSDTRIYVRDESGKVIAESYGRSGDDFTSKTGNGYISEHSHGSLNGLIEDIREIVYTYHQNNWR